VTGGLIVREERGRKNDPTGKIRPPKAPEEGKLTEARHKKTRLCGSKRKGNSWKRQRKGKGLLIRRDANKRGTSVGDVRAHRRKTEGTQDKPAEGRRKGVQRKSERPSGGGAGDGGKPDGRPLTRSGSRRVNKNVKKTGSGDQVGGRERTKRIKGREISS